MVDVELGSTCTAWKFRRIFRMAYRSKNLVIVRENAAGRKGQLSESDDVDGSR